MCFVLLGAAGASQGCSCESEPEGLVVSLQSDFVAAIEFDRVETSVDGAGEILTSVSAGESFDRPRPLTTYRDLEPGRREVQVQLWAGARRVASRRVMVEFRGSQLVNVVIARTCAGIECAAHQTCAGGVCVNPTCVTGAEPSCPRPQCIAPADCASDTSCVAPSCVAGICLETTGSGCASDELCLPGTGCVPRPSLDAGAARDGGRLDAASPGDAATDATGCGPASCIAGPCETAHCVGGVCERTSTCAETDLCCGGVCAVDCGSVECAGRPAGEVCRPSRGPCDVEERCDGSAACPADAIAPGGAECRAALGSCDAPERCDGASTECPDEPGRRYGDACCPGAGCEPGSACLGTRCAVFGGSYAQDQSGNFAMPCQGNPLAGAACACPAGFVARQLEDLDGAADEGAGWQLRHFVCVANDAPTTGTDFAGAYAFVTTGNPHSVGCTTACSFPSSVSGACACSSGASSVVVTGVHYLAGSSLDCEREVTYCVGPSAPLSFGGTFWRHVSGRDSICDASLPVAQRCVANPVSGGCRCPAGFVEQVTPMMQSRRIDRGGGPEAWYCRGDLVVCGRTP